MSQYSCQASWQTPASVSGRSLQVQRACQGRLSSRLSRVCHEYQTECRSAMSTTLVSNPEMNGLLGHSSSFCQSVRHGTVCHGDSGLRVRVLIGVCLLELSHQESSNQSRGDQGARGMHPSNQDLRVMMPSCDHLIWHACCHDVVRCFSNAYRYCNEVLGSHGNSLEKNAERKGHLLFHVVRFLCSRGKVSQ